jgi:hypothetical protein
MKYLVLIPVLLLIGGCAQSNSQSAGRDTIVTAASPDQERALLGQVKALEGKWEMVGDDGKPQLATTYQVSSGGNVVREVMFPGASHEMTNVYHMDGSDLVMTHYCAVGNQPRMRAARKSGNTIHFTFDSVTNHTSRSQTCMREMSLEVVDNDHIVQRWKSYQDGKPVEGADFVLTRVK